MTKLSPPQAAMLARVPPDWKGLPIDVGETNTTLGALVKAGAVEIRRKPGTRLAWNLWDWKRKEPVDASGS